MRNRHRVNYFVCAATFVILLSGHGICEETCGPEQFRCSDGSCIPDSWVCDRTFDCPGREDEHTCVPECSSRLYECDNGNCIHPRFKCNGIDECGDNSDETICGNFTSSPTCTAEQFTCKESKTCVHKDVVCDEVLDCRDGSDESQCQVHCRSEEFFCGNSSRCISTEHLCDGILDCEDGSDEVECDSGMFICKDNPNNFLCVDHSGCIKVHEVCDGAIDCKDGSDEQYDCSTTCDMNHCHSCQPSPNGALCRCNKGYKLSSAGRCEDINECNLEDERVCSQNCRNTPGYFRCDCLEGYDLASDKRTCKARGEEPVLVFATRDEVRRLTLHKRVYDIVLDHLHGLQAVAIGHDFQKIFWSEFGDGVAPEVFSEDLASPAGSRKPKASYGLVRPVAMDYDNTREILYILDQARPAILGCYLLDACTLIFDNSTLNDPTSLALHVSKGMMYWVDHDGVGTSVIMNGTMDGKKPRVFVSSGLHKVTALYLDYTTEMLFWYDSFYRNVERISVDGTGRKIVLSSVSVAKSCLAVFEDELFWFSDESHSIMAANKFTGRKKRMLIEAPGVVYLGVSHPVLAPTDDVFHQCIFERCSHICLGGPDGKATCACAEGYKLEPTSEMCEEVLDDHSHAKLFVSARDSILSLPLTTGAVLSRPIKTDNMRNVFLLAPAQEPLFLIYSSSMENGKIGIYQLSTDSGLESIPMIEGLSGVESVAVGAAMSVIYWVDSMKGTIELASLDGVHRSRLAIPTSHPHALAVDPSGSFLFYSDLGTPVSIRKCQQDGRHCQILVSSGLQRPNCLVVYEGCLYWSDYRAGVISSVKLNGDDKRKLAVVGGSPQSIAVFKTRLFWTEMGSGSIYFKDLSRGQQSVIRTDADQLSGLAVYCPHGAEARQCMRDNGGCDHLCLPLPGGDVSCLCDDGYTLAHDSRSCVKDVNECNGFLCNDGVTCVKEDRKCNSKHDCPDGSDEWGCESFAQECDDTTFKCASGGCVPLSFECDGEKDCKDGSDEEHCTARTCRPDEHQCDSHCFSAEDLCDGFPDCADGSDEANCGSTNTCAEGYFPCDNHCWHESWWCDGDEDCNDGSDEENCAVTCAPDQHRCDTGTCIAVSDFCDGVNNCESGEDEADCNSVKGTLDCFFTCYDGGCLHERDVCDGIPHCTDHEDESPQTCRKSCEASEFQCGNKECIPANRKCDGGWDCADGSDELMSLCPRPTSAAPRERCAGSYECDSGECVSRAQVCDGAVDCRDGSDEYNCKITCKDYHCNHRCENTKEGPKCFCDKGYKLIDSFTCDDIDECLVKNGGCSQVCVNRKGDYRCECAKGYVWIMSENFCKAKEGSPKLYIGSGSGIKSITSDGSFESQVVPMETMAAYLDINVHTNDVVWAQYEKRFSPKMSLYKSENGKPKLISRDVGAVKGIAIDWFTGNIYVTQEMAGANLISIYDTQGVHGVLVNEGQFKPTSIALHPHRGVMFWVASAMSGDQLRKACMSGDHQTTLISDVGIRPTSLCVDFAADRLYWLNGYSGQIETAKLDGSDRFTPIRSLPSKIFAMDVFEGVAYLTDQGSNTVNAVNAYSSRQQLLRKVTVSRPGPIKVSHELRQPAATKDNRCANKSCMYLCVLTPHGAQCVCPDGQSSKANPHCEGPRVTVEPITSTVQPSAETTTSTAHVSSTGHKTSASSTTSSAQTTAPVSTSPSSYRISTSPSSTAPAATNSTNTSEPCHQICLNGGTCVVQANSSACSCPSGYQGPVCEHKEDSTEEDHKTSLAWMAVVVVALGLVVVVALVAGCYRRYRKNNYNFMSTIKYLHTRTGKGKESDRTELVPEISFFSNPGFQEEIDQEAETLHAEAYHGWWQKLLDRSRRSVDSAFMGSDPSSGSIGDAEKGEMADDQPENTDTVHLLD